jgi:hypothetical protein
MRPRYGRIYGKAVSKRAPTKMANMQLTLCGKCDYEVPPGLAVFDAEYRRMHPFCKRVVDEARRKAPTTGRSLKTTSRAAVSRGAPSPHAG